MSHLSLSTDSSEIHFTPCPLKRSSYGSCHWSTLRNISIRSVEIKFKKNVVNMGSSAKNVSGKSGKLYSDNV